MFSFLKKSTSADAQSSVSTHDLKTPPPSTQQNTNIRRELIVVVLKDTLRLQGIPYDWISCDVFVVSHPQRGEEFHVQLVVMKWNELLMRYAMALQYQLLRGLNRFDPSNDHSKYFVSWRFSPDCGCPFRVMPPPMIWTHAETSVENEASPAILDRRHKIRPPKALTPMPTHTSTLRSTPVDYERTELASFSCKPSITTDPREPSLDDDYERTQLSPLR